MYTTETLTSVHLTSFLHCFSFFNLSTDRHRSVVQYTVYSPCTHIWIETRLETIVFSETSAFILSSGLQTNLVRHRNLAVRASDGRVQWTSLCSKPRHAFQSEGAQTVNGWTISTKHKNQISILHKLDQQSHV